MVNINYESIPWWKKTVVYQIYPRSYMDSDGDGLGDLKGILSKLDYIKDLGVETVWFSPFYPSPWLKVPYSQHDCGYDISDYRNIHPQFGKMEDFQKLVEEMHKRGLKIVLDMVMNHTSIEHTWFQESRSSKDNPKRNWYIWRDGKKPNGKKPPNNWFGMTGKCWDYDPHTGQWYYHAFLPFQPDLNYRNPELQQEMLDTVRYWLKKGVDGFRLDIINALFEDAEFRNAPRVFKVFSEDMDVLFKSSKMNYNHPDTLDFCKKLRATIDEFPGKFIVGEVSASMQTLKKYLGETKSDGVNADGLNLVFLFKSLKTPFKASKIRDLITTYEKWFPDPYYPNWVFGNHDQMRRISRLGDSIEKAKLNLVLQLTARGTPFIYFGEELGMRNAKSRKKDSRDAVSYHFKMIPQFVRNIAAKMGLLINRDGCRTPMQWDQSENAGFSPVGIKPWLPVESMYKERNVIIEEKDPDSLLHFYKRFLKLRKETPALNAGKINLINSGYPNSILAYERNIIIDGKEQIAHIFLNFSEKNITIKNPVSNPQTIVSTSINTESFTREQIKFAPWEGIVVLE